MKIQKKFWGGGRWGGGGGGGFGVGLGGQSGCERRIEVFVKIQKKKFFFWGGGVGGGVGVGLWVRLDVNEELNFCENSKKKLGGGGKGGGRGGGGVRGSVGGVGLGAGSGWM